MRNMILRIPTEQKLEARFLKFIPKNWVGPRSLKLEIYGCSKGNKICTQYNHPQFYPGRFAHQNQSSFCASFLISSILFVVSWVLTVLFTSLVELLLCACAVGDIKIQSCCCLSSVCFLFFISWSEFLSYNAPHDVDHFTNRMKTWNINVVWMLAERSSGNEAWQNHAGTGVKRVASAISV